MTLSFLIEIAWKSALIAGAALLLVTLLRSRSASDRAAVLKLSIALLLLLPVLAYAMPELQVEALEAEAAAPAPAVTVVPAAAEFQLPATALADVAAPLDATMDFTFWDYAGLFAALAYLAGALVMALRLGAGVATLGIWTRRAEPVTAPEWLNALDRSNSSARQPLLLVSGDVNSPLSWGFRNPVILLDPDSLERPKDADAIVAHEMAHVERGDWVTLILARAAVGIFWFNPLVWLLERQVVQHAEEAADARALALVEPCRYAETLVTCARHLTNINVPANSIAPTGSGLSKRVRAILEGRALSIPSGSRWTRMAMIGCAGFAAPVAALELIPAALPQSVLPAGPPAASVPLTSMFASITADRIRTPEPVAAAVAVASAEAEEPVEARQVAVQVDEEAIRRSVEEATRNAGLSEAEAERLAERIEAQAEREAERIAERAERDAERIEAQVERQMERQAAQIERDTERLGERISRQVEQSVSHSLKSSRGAYASGAKGMLEGAASMERGAKQMELAAANLAKKEYREHKIAAAARKGKKVTHEELIASIPGLREGARGMREGAAEMRAGAEEMRLQGI